MTPRPFPTVASFPMPASVLRALPQASAPAAGDASPPPTDPAETAEALAPLISAAIARRARQRRYTR